MSVPGRVLVVELLEGMHLLVVRYELSATHAHTPRWCARLGVYGAPPEEELLDSFEVCWHFMPDDPVPQELRAKWRRMAVNLLTTRWRAGERLRLARLRWDAPLQ